jgi:hypothetical protein
MGFKEIHTLWLGLVLIQQIFIVGGVPQTREHSSG